MRHRLPAVAMGFALLMGACSDAEPASPAQSSAVSAAPSTTAATIEPTTSATTTTTPELPQPNEVVVGIDQRPDSLNPLAPGGDNQIVLEINQAIGIGLTETHGETLELVPDLAMEIPSVANGGVVVARNGTTTVTFQLRDEAVWEDGTPISGDDIAFTYESIVALVDRPFLSGPYEAITAIGTSAKTVTLTFAEPTLAFETMFPFVIPRHQVEGTDPVADWLQTPWLSAGPFLFEPWEGDELALTRNSAFWKSDPDTGAPLPHLDRLVFRYIPETAALIDAFTSGETDIVGVPPWSGMIDRLSELEGIEVEVRNSAIWEHFTFQFGERNPNPESLNQHVDFRRAIFHLIDREAILDLGFWGTRTGLDSILGVHGAATDQPWAQYPHDPVEARRLLGELCSRLGRDCAIDPPRVVFSTTSNADERPAIGRLLVEMLAVGGIEAELDLQDSSLYFGPTISNGAWDLGMWAWFAQPSPAGILRSLAIWDPAAPITGDPSGGPRGLPGTNYSRWGTPSVCCSAPADSSSDGTSVETNLDQGASTVLDEHTVRYAEILDQMRTTADHEVFADLAREAEQILADQVVFIPLLTRSSVGAVWTNRVEGYIHSPWLFTWNVEEWSRFGV